MDITDITKKRAMVSLLEDPSSVAYLNIYEEGDVWVKIKGCSGCPPESANLCCNDCKMKAENGCFMHSGNKPHICTVVPYPDLNIGYCQQEFKCIKGKHLNKIRKIKEPAHIFRDK